MPFLLFVVLPLVELWLLIRVGSAIGALTVVALVVGAAVLGVAVLQRQGFHTLGRVRAALARGEEPAAEMFDGMLVAMVGVLLILPGLLTDAAALVLWIPALRRSLGRRLLGATLVRRRAGQRRGDLIEGDFRREDSRRED